jgi:hypothetical protein
MEPISVLKSAEELVLELAMWPWATGRTMWRVFVKPWWAQEHVAAEWDKDPRDRDITFMRPMLFWLLWVAVPYYLLLNYLLAKAAQGHPWATWVYEQPWSLKLVIMALFLISGPFSFARRIYRRLGSPQDPRVFNRLVITQCLCLVPFYLVTLVVLLGGICIPQANILSRILQGMLYLSMAHWGYAEAAVCYKEFGGDWARVGSTVFKGFGAWCVRLLISISIVMAFFAVITAVPAAPAPSIAASANGLPLHHP